MRSTLTLVALLGAALPVSAQEEETVWYERAEALVEDLRQERFGDAEAKMAPEVAAQLDAARLAGVWGQLTGAAGPLGEVTRRSHALQGELHVVELDAAFERQTLLVRVAMKPDGTVAGLWFLPPGSGASARADSEQKGPPYADPSRFREVEVTVGSAPWELGGTLTVPSGSGPFPAVVLVHGSGPNDRDETIGPNRPFRDLAWGLAMRGVATLRYDKRTKVHGARMKSGAITVDEEVIDDAVQALSVARARPEIDAERVYVAGHSLGGMLAPAIAVRDGQVAGAILMAGPARSVATLLVEQLTYIASLPESQPTEVQTQLQGMIEQAEKLKKHEAAPETMVMGAPASYTYDLDARDPVKAVRGVTAPVLVLQGGRDYQVTETDLGLWRDALSGRTDASTRLYPDLNHLFMEGAGKATPGEYARPGFVAEKVIEDVAEWVKTGGLPAR